MRIRFRNPFKKRKQFQEPVIIIRRYERMNFSPLTEGQIPSGGIKVIEERYTATRIIEMERQIEELKEKAVVWDMIDKWLEDKVGTCLVLQFKGVKLELRRSQFFQEAIKKADSEVIKL